MFHRNSCPPVSIFLTPYKTLKAITATLQQRLCCKLRSANFPSIVKAKIDKGLDGDKKKKKKKKKKEKISPLKKKTLYTPHLHHICSFHKKNNSFFNIFFTNKKGKKN